MDMVTAPLSQLDKGDYTSQELVYLHRNTRQPNHHSPFNLMDLYLSNKIIKKKFLEEFRFSGDTPGDVHRLYQETQFQKVHQHNLFSFKEEEELLESLQTPDRRLKAKIKLVLSCRRVFYQGLKLKRNQ
jgi:DNA-binding transcriptional regulator WhiA